MAFKTLLNKFGIGDSNEENSENGAGEEIVDEDVSDDADLIETDEDASNEDCDPNNYFAPEDAVWYKDKVLVNGKHARTYAIDSWPPAPSPGLFRALVVNADLDYDLSLHYKPYTNSEAVDQLDNIEDKLEGKRTGEFSRFIPDKGALKETEKVVGVMKRYINQGDSMFDVSFYLTVYADSQDELEDAHSQLRRDLSRSASVSLTKNPLRQKSAMQSASPIGKDVLGDKNDVLKQKMLGSGAAQTFPFIQDTFMEENGVMFGVNEESMTPVIIDVFNRRNGYNMITSGMIGAGKSFSSAQILLAMDAAYSNFQQFIVDPMGGFQGVNHALDGDRVVINGDVSVNPLEIHETPQEVIEKSDGQVNPWTAKKAQVKWFFSQFFSSVGNNEEELTNDEISTLDKAITETYHKKNITKDISTHSNESPTIMDLIETLKEMANNAREHADTDMDTEITKRENIALDLLIAMDPFKPGGEYHNLAQPTQIDISGDRTVYLDLSQIPENSDDLGVMMKLLFMNIYQEAKNTDNKVALTIDESHKIFRDAGITSGLEEMFRHSRHFDLSINLISQTPEEFYSTEVAQTIAKQCTIKRFHRVDDIKEEVAKDILDMNEEEINYIKNAEMGEGDKDYSTALLRISDEDRSIPLRIYATSDEGMVIDYDPTESIDEYTDPRRRDLKNALDMKNRTEVPKFGGDISKLSDKVISSIAKAEKDREAVLDSVKESEEKQQEIENEDEGLGIPIKDSPTITDNTDDGEVVDTNERMRKRLESAENVDDRGENEIRLIGDKLGVVESDDSLEVIKEKIKVVLFSEYESPVLTEEEVEELESQTTTEADTQTNQPTQENSRETLDAGDSGSNQIWSDVSSSTQGNNTGGVGVDQASVDEIDELEPDQIETMYGQYIGDNSDLTTAEKREVLKEEFAE